MSYPPDFPPPRASTGSNQFPTLTREEKNVLKECAQESLYQRCLPLMTTLGLGAYYGVNLGYLKKNAMYGAIPKVVIGVVVGFIAGKFSYQQQCEEKILRLPGGRLKESVLMRRNRQNGLWSNDGELYGNANYARPSYRGQNINSYDDSRLLSDSDVERSDEYFFDDSFKSRSDLSDDGEHQLPRVSPSQSVSYNELRSHNRDEYDSRRRQYRPGPMNDYSPHGEQYSSAAQPPNRNYIKPENDDRYNRSIYADEDPAYFAPPQPRESVQRKNFYGDIIER